MRLFVAVDVDQTTREAATRLRATLRRERPAVERALRWVEPENLHLTLRFLGDREDLDALQQVLAAPFSQPGFSFQWKALAWLPPHGRARVLHAAVGEGATALGALAAEIAGRLAALGIPPEDRPFTAHLTLARVRDGAEPGIVRQLAALMPAGAFAPLARVAVESVVLYESRLSPRGPTYLARHRCVLS